MKYEEFANMALQEMTNRFPTMEIHLQRVEKIQGQSYNGMVVKAPEESVGMTFNLDGYYRKQGEAGSSTEVLAELEESIRHAEPRPPMVDTEALRSYEKMRECLSMQLIPRKGNEEMLKKEPHITHKDMAVVVRFVLPCRPSEEASVLVTNDLLNSYHISSKHLIRDAYDITPARHPLTVKSMEEVLLGSPEETGGSGLWVVGNDTGRYGAAAVFYPGALDTIGRKFGCGYYLIPSSVHEMLAVPDPMCIGSHCLDRMVENVNEAEVAEEDRLTDHSYHYDFSEKKFETGKEYEARLTVMEG